MKVGLVQARFPGSRKESVEQTLRWIGEAGRQGCDVVCFPEGFVPGLRECGFEIEPHDQAAQEAALEEVRAAAAAAKTAVILSMEWGPHLVAMVIDEQGSVLGYQAKNQIPVVEEPHFVPDGKRRIFMIKGVPIGIAICHEAWRYPETVRWAAMRGAKVVFHPQVTGSAAESGPADPFYHAAMMCRSMENTIYFASVNCAMGHQESETSLFAPDGKRVAFVPYGEEQLLVADLDLEQATGFLAKRYNPDLYQEGDV